MGIIFNALIKGILIIPAAYVPYLPDRQHGKTIVPETYNITDTVYETNTIIGRKDINRRVGFPPGYQFPYFTHYSFINKKIGIFLCPGISITVFQQTPGYRHFFVTWIKSPYPRPVNRDRSVAGIGYLPFAVFSPNGIGHKGYLIILPGNIQRGTADRRFNTCGPGGIYRRPQNGRRGCASGKDKHEDDIQTAFIPRKKDTHDISPLPLELVPYGEFEIPAMPDYKISVRTVIKLVLFTFVVQPDPIQ
jgi:hypothetical protein